MNGSLPFHWNEDTLLVNPMLLDNLEVSHHPDHDERFMRLALAEARRAGHLGEVPVGALIVRNQTVIATAYNRRETTQNPTAHAELLAIQAASSALGTWRLTGTSLYATLEPCPMCAGALLQARVDRLVFAAFDPKAGACGSLCNLTAETRFNHRISVTGGILEEESRHLLQTFFQTLRQRES